MQPADCHGAVQLLDDIIEMLTLAREAFVKRRAPLVSRIQELSNRVHEREQALLGENRTGGDTERHAPEAMIAAMHIGRISDNIEAFGRAVERQARDSVLFTDRATHEIDRLLEKALELLQATRDVLRTGNRTLVRHVLTDGPAFQATASEFAAFHQERLIQGLCAPRASSVYLAMVDYLRGIERHQREMVARLGATARVYLDSDDSRKADVVASAVRDYLRSVGLDPEQETKEKARSWYYEFYSKTVRALNSREVADRLQKAERAVQLAVLDKNQSEIDKNQAEAAATLLMGLKGTANAAIQIGSLVVVKATDEHGEHVLARTLRQREMIELEKYSHLLQDPLHLLQYLAAITADTTDNDHALLGNSSEPTLG